MVGCVNTAPLAVPQRRDRVTAQGLALFDRAAVMNTLAGIGPRFRMSIRLSPLDTKQTVLGFGTLNATNVKRVLKNGDLHSCAIDAHPATLG